MIFKQALVVDDDPLYRGLVNDVLSMRSIPVVSATNGAEALNLLSSTDVDLIVCDIEMPAMDGFSFHSRIRQEDRFKNTPFVFITGATDSATLGKVRQRPDVRLIRKSNIVPELFAFLDHNHRNTLQTS